MKDFNSAENVLMRKLVNDRIEDRFKKASYAATVMDLKLLKGCTQELVELTDLKEKLEVLE